MGDEHTLSGEVVYLLSEVRSEERGTVYEIGSRARVVGSEGDELTLEIDGSRGDVVRCSSTLVSRKQRSNAARRRFAGTAVSPA